MLARVARLLFIAWFAVLLIVLALVRIDGWSPATAIVLYVLLFGHPTLLAIEMVLARRIGGRSAASRATWPAMARALLAEWIASAVIFGWRMPWRVQAVEDHLPASSRGVRGVVFIHGYICNRGLWNPWMARLRRLDRACVAVTLEPIFASMEDYVPLVERAVRRVEAATGLAPVIVAHSMGGLVARAWLRWRRTDRRDDAADAAARIITIGTPHQGTWIAGMATSPNGREMRQGSEWLTALAASEPATLPGLITSWWTECDQVVYPPPTAVYPGSESKQLRAAGHIAMTSREEIWNEIRRRIDY